MMKEKGFTLVELSIVLVIIGLLIGGILVSKSMIETAKVQKIVKQLGEYDAVISTFRDQYKQLPGDSVLFTNNGNNDGHIDLNESANVWYHLSLGADLKNTKGISYVSNASFNNTEQNCPIFDITQFTVLKPCLQLLYVYDVVDPSIPRDNKYQYYGISDGGVLPAKICLALDKKLDDGLPDSGTIKAFIQDPDTAPDCYITATPRKYATTNSTYGGCNLQINSVITKK